MRPTPAHFLIERLTLSSPLHTLFGTSSDVIASSFVVAVRWRSRHCAMALRYCLLSFSPFLPPLLGLGHPSRRFPRPPTISRISRKAVPASSPPRGGARLFFGSFTAIISTNALLPPPVSCLLLPTLSSQTPRSSQGLILAINMVNEVRERLQDQASLNVGSARHATATQVVVCYRRI